MEAKELDRIREMEEYLVLCSAATRDLKKELDRMGEIRESMIRLFRYYGSEEWYKDRDLEIPEGVSAGVLSEDLVYDEITDVRDAALQMLELATDILKNRI